MPDVVLPVLDERAALPWVLERMPPGYRPIVVDNGSTDGSGELAAQRGADVVREPVPGFGAACFAGLTAASDELVCFMDCDASFDPRELPRVADPVAAGAADLVLGARTPVPGAVWPAHARAGRRPPRREDLLALNIRDRRFGWPLEMVLRASGAGWRLREVPVSYLAREGRSKITGTLTGTVRTVRDMSSVLR